jgi:predicted transcriptional regulator
MNRSTDISRSGDSDETRDWSDEKRAAVARGLEQARAREFMPDPRTSQSERPIAGEAFEQFLDRQLKNPDDRAEFEHKLADVKQTVR